MSVDPRRARMQARTATPVQQITTPASTATPPAAVNTPPPPFAQQAPATQSPIPQSTTENASATPTTAPPATPPPSDSSYKLTFCTVCASNNNRSMEAHLRLSTSEHQYPVISFGTGSYVRLPGPSISQPQVYEFNTTSYDKMFNELQAQDAKLYKNNGILNMLDRNRNIKWGPERFHDWIAGAPRIEPATRGDKGALGAEGGTVDVIFTCEERCWDAVVENLLERGAPLNKPVHVFNVDIRDNHEEALVGGRAILELADLLNDAACQERNSWSTAGWENGNGAARTSFDERVPDILADWQQRWPNLPALWTLSWL